MNLDYVNILALVQKICDVAFWLCALTFLYKGILVFCGIPQSRRMQQISRSYVQPKTRFAILIMARNEEKSLTPLLESLQKQDYPQELYQVIVVADNCTDNTAGLASRLGAEVYERFDLEHATKGYALSWFFKQQRQDILERFDYCVIFDADNQADRNFLKIMDRHAQVGHRVMAGYHDSANAGENILTAANSLFWFTQLRFQHQARTNLGLPLTSVSGTGFCFALDIIKDYGWETYTMTEDVEFTMQCILRGERAVLVREAIYIDRQSNNWHDMLRQRFRWSVGTVQVLRLYAPALFARSTWQDIKCLDGFWFLAQIPFFFLAGIMSLVRMLMLIPVYLGSSSHLAKDLLVPVVFYFATVLLMALLVKLEKQDLKIFAPAILLYPVFGLIWGVQQVGALFVKNATWLPLSTQNSTAVSHASAQIKSE